MSSFNNPQQVQQYAQDAQAQMNAPPAPPVNNTPAFPAPQPNSYFGPGVTNPQNPYAVVPPTVTPDDMIAADVQGRQGLMEGQKQANQATLDAANAKAEAEQSRAVDENKVYNSHENESFASSERSRLAQAMYTQDAAKLYQEKQSVIKERTDYANSMPTDLWGASGVNKVAGIIGLALGALGGAATGGKNAALESMNALADSNIRRMKMHYDMLGDKIEGIDNTYAQMRQKFGDDTSAELGTRLVMNENFTNQLKQADLKTVSKSAKANVQQVLAQIAEQNQELQEKLKLNTDKTVGQAAQAANTKYSIDAQHAEHREAMNAQAGSGKMDGEINGFDAPDNPGLRLSKAATDKSREEQQGVREVHETIADIKEKLANGGLSSALEKTQAEAALKLAIVKAHNLSRRVGGDEGKLIEQDAGHLAIGLKGFLANEFDHSLVIKLMNDLDRSTERGYVKGLETNGYKVSKGGMYDHSNDAATDTRDGNPLSGIPLRGQQ